MKNASIAQELKKYGQTVISQVILCIANAHISNKYISYADNLTYHKDKYISQALECFYVF